MEECFPLNLKTIYSDVVTYYKEGYNTFYVLNYSHNVNDRCVLSALLLLKENHREIQFNLIVLLTKDDKKRKAISELSNVDNTYYPNDENYNDFFIEDMDSVLFYIIDEKTYTTILS